MISPARFFNLFSSINLTKLDVLDQLAEIKIGTAYIHKGQKLDSFPADLHVLEEVTVEYETLPGWQTDISACRTWDELPEKAKQYVARVEQLLDGVKVEWIGVGAGRDAMIHRP